MQDLFERYGLTYTTGSFPKQLTSAWTKVVRLSLPNRAVGKAAATVTSLVPSTVTRALRAAA